MSKAGRVDWAAKTKFWKASRERAESTEERGVLARGTGLLANGDDRQWLSNLLAHPKLSSLCRAEAVTDRLLRAHEWLVANPGLHLHAIFRDRFQRLERLLALIEEGKVDPTAEYAKRGRARVRVELGIAAARARKAAKAANVPDWMTDPSKLPKKPPASRPPDD